MSISGITPGTTASNIENWQTAMLRRQQDFQSIGNSLKSGDLGGAQQAYSDLAALTSANGASASKTGPVKQDFATLGKDLTSGNLSQAQTDFQQMQTDLQSALSQNGGAAGVHHHGHHSHKVDTSSTQTQSTTAAASGDSTLSSSISNLLSQYSSPGAGDSSLTASLFNLLG
jgi:hypothetical protein